MNSLVPIVERYLVGDDLADPSSRSISVSTAWPVLMATSSR